MLAMILSMASSEFSYKNLKYLKIMQMFLQICMKTAYFIKGNDSLTAQCIPNISTLQFSFAAAEFFNLVFSISQITLHFQLYTVTYKCKLQNTYTFKMWEVLTSENLCLYFH